MAITLTVIKEMLGNQIKNLEQARDAAFTNGDIESFARYELEVEQTKNTLKEMP